MIGKVAFILFAATIPAANWLIGNVGVQFGPNEPHLIPVGLGLMAPSGVLMVGAALVLRDIVHERLGGHWALAAIAAGAILSAFLAPPALVVASVAAFALAELADFAVYAPLRRKQLGLAVLASGIVGAVIDSAVFLWLAFGSFAHIDGQILGKVWMSAAAFAVLVAMRSVCAARSMTPPTEDPAITALNAVLKPLGTKLSHYEAYAREPAIAAMRAVMEAAAQTERDRCAMAATEQTFDAHELEQATDYGRGMDHAARTILADITTPPSGD